MAKVSRTYRFDPQTLNQIRWLAARLGGLDDTSVLRVAVAELYHRKRAEWKACLMPQPDGTYALQVHGRELARISQPTLEHLPAGVGDGLLAAEADGLSALTMLLLGAAAAGETVWLDEAVLGKLTQADRDPD